MKPLPSQAVMDDAARRLGAADADAFLGSAPRSVKCAFRLICDLIAKHEPPVAGEGHGA